MVSGRPDAVEPVARSIANSPLVKTALHGGDPNFGRILQAAGQAGRRASRSWPTSRSRATRWCPPATSVERGRRAELVSGDEIEYVLTMPGEGGETEVFFSDLSRRIRQLQRGLHLMRDVATLLEALPYIREFHGQTVVIKYGGAAMVDPELKEEFARDVVLLKYVGMNPVVVHGGGPDITSYMERLGMEVRFVDGLRVSDEATVEVAKMVLVGKQNKDIVLGINRHGQPAVGLCGDDGRLFTVRKRLAGGETDIGFVGDIETRGRGRAAPHRRGLHPGGGLGGRRHRGQVLQRERRRRRGGGGGGARRLQARLPDRRGGLARRPGRPGQPHLRGHRRRRCASGCPR